MNHLFFWGGVFSNFHPINGDTSNTSEKKFMEAKAIRFGDRVALERIRLAKTPNEAKEIGRQVRGYHQAMWDEIKVPCMMSALQFKWNNCEEFRKALKESGENILVEASPYDRIWGIGYKSDTALAYIDNWGENLLGKCLMNLRSENV